MRWRRSPRRPRATRSSACSERGQPVFTRDIAMGGQVHLDALHARAGGGRGSTSRRLGASCAGSCPTDVSADQVATVLREASAPARPRGSQDHRLLPGDRARREAEPVVLSGGAWQAVGLVDLLASGIRGAGRRVRSVPARDAAEPRAGRRRGRPGLRRGGRVSRCGRKATDDPGQPARQTSPGAAPGARVAAAGPAVGRSSGWACCSARPSASAGGGSTSSP